MTTKRKRTRRSPKLYGWSEKSWARDLREMIPYLWRKALGQASPELRESLFVLLAAENVTTEVLVKGVAPTYGGVTVTFIKEVLDQAHSLLTGLSEREYEQIYQDSRSVNQQRVEEFKKSFQVSDEIVNFIANLDFDAPPAAADGLEAEFARLVRQLSEDDRRELKAIMLAKLEAGDDAMSAPSSP